MAVASSSPSRSPKQDADSASETSSVKSGSTPDRRDVEVSALTARSEEYRLLFRLPPDEVLVQDFNCALQENILLQGHMYLFVHHICFYSNIFGFETKKTIPFNEITCVRKAKTAAIFPNAIEIVTGDKKHFFGSFLSRDEAHRLIIDRWAQHNSDVKAFLDRQESKSDSSQDNTIIMVEKLDRSPLSEDVSSSAVRSKDANCQEMNEPLLNNRTEGSESVSDSDENREEENVDPTSSAEPGIWEIQDLEAPNISDRFTLVIEAKFSVCVEDFFALFISDPDFVRNFHQSCGDKDFQCTPWRRNDQFGCARDLSFVHPVKVYIGAKFGRCQEVQKYRVYKDSHLVIETSQQISDVPFADYFHVERIWDIVRGTKENSCILKVYFNVVFTKKTIFKGKIEQSTKDELRDVHGIWVKNAHEILKQKNVEKPKGLSGKQKEVENSLDLKESVGNSRPTVISAVPAQMVPVDSTVTECYNPAQENSGSPLLAISSLRNLWSTLVPHTKPQSYVLLAFVTILILMQISIFILLIRVPQVHVITREHQSGSLVGYEAENAEWLEKRIDYLKEEMFMVETRIERMHHEHAMLKKHLQSFERLKRKQ